MLDNNFYFNYIPSINAIQFNDTLLDITTGEHKPWISSAFDYTVRENVTKGLIKESYFRSFEYFTANESIQSNVDAKRKIDFIIGCGLLSEFADYELTENWNLEQLLEYLGYYDLKESVDFLNEGFFKKIKDKVKSVAKKVGTAISNTASKVASTAKNVVSKAATAVKSGVKAGVKAVGTVAKKVGDLAMSGIGGILKGIKGIVKFIPKILDFFKNFKSILSGGLVKIIDFVVKGADMLKPVIKAVPSLGRILTALSGVSAFAKASLVNEGTEAEGDVDLLNESLGAGGKTQKGYIMQGVTLMGMAALGVHVDSEKNKTILNTIQSALNGGKGLAQSILPAVGAALGIKLDKVMNFLTEPAKAIASLISGIISSAHALVKKFWDLIGGEKLLSKFLDTVLGKLLKKFVGLFKKKDKAQDAEQQAEQEQEQGEQRSNTNDIFNVKGKDNSGDFE